MNNLSKDVIDRIVSDEVLRREITKESHGYFLPVYFRDYIKHPSAPFHHEMIEMTEDTETKLTVVTAFRGSAKSTIFALSYPIWAILGKQEKKFVLLISRTQTQAKQLLQNIKVELERNELLKSDLGPFEEPTDEWRSSSIVIPQYDARIMVLSADQSMRGIRHKSFRPDLIICDDVEDIASTKTQESRDKTFKWFTSEIIPAGDLSTKIVVIGNLVHEDSLIMRLREKIINGEVKGVFKSYPLIDMEGNCLWKEKFSTQEDLDKLKSEVMSDQAWEREYLLKIIPDDSQIIDPLWIRTTSTIPKEYYQIGVFVGVDLAISQEARADYTAMVPIMVCEYQRQLYLYVLPEIVHKKMNFTDTCKEIRFLDLKLESKYKTRVHFLIESVAYQQAVIDFFDKEKVNAYGVKPMGSKRERLQLVAMPMEARQIFFSHENTKELIQELVGFGSEKHDDLVDALTLAVLEVLINKKPTKPGLLIA